MHYAYDGAGRTVGISDPFGETTRFVYDGAGRRVQKLGTQGHRTEYGYDPGTGWLTGVTSWAATGSVASAFTYPVHDDVGNRLSMTETGGGSTSYSYDALDRLATLDPPNESIYPANGALTHFAYDAAGNRTDFGPKSGSSFVSPHTTYTYNALQKRLTAIKVDGVTVESLGSYDANGNPGTWTPPGGSARTLKFDALGRLVEISGGFSASYVYDPFGRRIEKTEQGVATRYQYDGLDVVAEYSASQLEATYVFGPGIDEVLKLKRGATVAAYHTDGLGSVASITDATSGGSLETYRYDAFGKPIAQTGSTANAYTYTGRELDASGLYYYRARYYLPSAGRFLTPDPIGLAGGINAYVYVSSNPVNYTDPFGLFAGGAFESARPANPLFSPDPLADYDHWLAYTSGPSSSTYRVQVLRTVPFAEFGGGFEGGPKVAQTAVFDFSGQDVVIQDPVQYPSRAISLPATLFGDYAIGEPWRLHSQGVFTDLDHATASFGFAGTNPLTPSLATPRIDTIVDLDVVRSNGYLRVSGTLSGDDFPYAFVFVEDYLGQRRSAVYRTQRGGSFLDGPMSLASDDGSFFHFELVISLDHWGNFAK